MQIGTREIGAGKPVFVIAEVGSNWRDEADCLASIRMANEAGADAVKFQHFTGRELYGRESDVRGGIPAEWFESLRAYADKRHIEFMCSAFSPEGYGRVDPFVNAHKVASCEAVAHPIVEAALSFGKPTIISMGALTLDEIASRAKVWDPLQVIPMYCRATYPAHDISPGVVCALARAFGPTFTIAVSDHSPSIFPFFGPVHEKHVNFVGCDSADAPHSLSGSDFARMVRHIRGQVELWSPPEQIMAIRRRFVPELNGWYRVQAS
jgi:sialic acid synthase SpsE